MKTDGSGRCLQGQVGASRTRGLRGRCQVSEHGVSRRDVARRHGLGQTQCDPYMRIQCVFCDKYVQPSMMFSRPHLAISCNKVQVSCSYGIQALVPGSHACRCGDRAHLRCVSAGRGSWMGAPRSCSRRCRVGGDRFLSSQRRPFLHSARKQSGSLYAIQ